MVDWRPVKDALLRDLGSRDREFLEVVAGIRERLLALGGPATHQDRDMGVLG